MNTATAAIVEELIGSFWNDELPQLTRRTIPFKTLETPKKGNSVHVIVGMRRTGKTSLLLQQAADLLEKGVARQQLLYFNFEDVRLQPYEPSFISDVVDLFFSLSPDARKKGAYLLFDEIQEVPRWGAALRGVVDRERVSILVTGSSSKMLSADIGTEFRGRSVSHELLPFSFEETCRHAGLSLSKPFSTEARRNLMRFFDEYLFRGGFPGVQGAEDPLLTLTLQSYATDTVMRDVVERYDLSKSNIAARFARDVVSYSGRELSVNALYRSYRSGGLSVSANLLYDLLDYYQDSFLVFTVGTWNRALREKTTESRKVYAIDPGLFRANAPSLSDDVGQRLETAVYGELRRRHQGDRRNMITRYITRRSRAEVDFCVGDALAETPFELIQVSANLDGGSTRQRELRALEEAMGELGISKSTIVTLSEERSLETATGVVSIVPAWKWFLDN